MKIIFAAPFDTHGYFLHINNPKTIRAVLPANKCTNKALISSSARFTTLMNHYRGMSQGEFQGVEVNCIPAEFTCQLKPRRETCFFSADRNIVSGPAVKNHLYYLWSMFRTHSHGSQVSQSVSLCVCLTFLTYSESQQVKKKREWTHRDKESETHRKRLNLENEGNMQRQRQTERETHREKSRMLVSWNLSCGKVGVRAEAEWEMKERKTEDLPSFRMTRHHYTSCLFTLLITSLFHLFSYNVCHLSKSLPTFVSEPHSRCYLTFAFTYPLVFN